MSFAPPPAEDGARCGARFSRRLDLTVRFEGQGGRKGRHALQKTVRQDWRTAERRVGLGRLLVAAVLDARLLLLAVVAALEDRLDPRVVEPLPAGACGCGNEVNKWAAPTHAT